VITQGIREFLSRDWDAARRSKDAYWADRIARCGPLEALRIADELRRQILMQDPAWPDAASRGADLLSHVRLSHLTRRVDSASRR
jgi:hypothetical protein